MSNAECLTFPVQTQGKIFGMRNESVHVFQCITITCIFFVLVITYLDIFGERWMSKVSATFCPSALWNHFSAQPVYLLLWCSKRSRLRTRRYEVPSNRICAGHFGVLRPANRFRSGMVRMRAANPVRNGFWQING